MAVMDEKPYISLAEEMRKILNSVDHLERVERITCEDIKSKDAMYVKFSEGDWSIVFRIIPEPYTKYPSIEIEILVKKDSKEISIELVRNRRNKEKLLSNWIIRYPSNLEDVEYVLEKVRKDRDTLREMFEKGVGRILLEIF